MKHPFADHADVLDMIADDMVASNRRAEREDRPDVFTRERIAALRAEAKECRRLAREDDLEPAV